MEGGMNLAAALNEVHSFIYKTSLGQCPYNESSLSRILYQNRPEY